MWDSMRVYVGGDDGTWDLISTNNSDPDTELAETINFIKEEYDDAQGWRQVRVPSLEYL